MGEHEAIERADEPVTSDDLVADLRDLGIDAGATVLVHASLSSMGWVVGGPQAMVDALGRAVGDAGTVVVPTHSAQYTDPAGWSNPPVPEDWYGTIRESMPPYRPDVTPSRGVGVIPECLRTYPDAIRSRHPVYSFAARGADAESIVAEHSFDDGLGEESPLGRVYDQNGHVLLLGVDHGANTSLHLAEHRADIETERIENTAPILRDGERVTISYEGIDTSTDDFEVLGAAFEREVGCRTASIGAAEARLLEQPALVDFGVEWLEENR